MKSYKFYYSFSLSKNDFKIRPDQIKKCKEFPWLMSYLKKITMSPGRYKIYDDRYPYFITSSIMFGLPLFSDRRAANMILENLKFLQEQRDVDIMAYVIMENHLHAILKGRDLSAKIGRFKSYSARKIIDFFKQAGRTKWLERLESVKPEIRSDREYQFWQRGYHPKQIIGDDMMIQKIEYIHNNPVKRGYVNTPEHWRYSSARNYVGIEGLIPVSIFKK